AGKEQRWVFLGICAAVLVWRCVLVFYFHSDTNRTYLGTDTRCDSLLLGCALAVAGNPMLDVDQSAERPSKRFVVALVISSIMLLISFVIRTNEFRESIRYTIQIFGIYGFFFAAIRYPKWGVFQLFNVRPMRFLGKLSYSLYLVHQVVIAVAWRWLPFGGIPRILLVFAGSLGLSWSIWQCIEKPCARLRKRLEVRPLGPAPTFTRG
ncbi:MAG TPA: acyltransferase, partial [Polyangiaceae bacterium]